MIGPVQLRWDRAGQHGAFLAGLRLLNRAPRLDLETLLELQTVLLPPSNPARGRYRDAPIQVRFNGVTHWRPPPPEEAVRLTAGTLERVNAAISSRLTGGAMKACAARALFEITDVHPFEDGNGRVARLVASWMLTRGGYALLMDPGLYCHERRDAYYHALDSKRLDTRPWTQFFEELVAHCFRAYVVSPGGRVDS